MLVPIRRLPLAVGAFLLPLGLVAACAEDTPDPASVAKSTASSAGKATTGPTVSEPAQQPVKVRFVNEWSSDPSGPALDVWIDEGTSGFRKILSGLAYGTASTEIEVNTTRGGAPLQVTRAGEQPETTKYGNNIQVSGIQPGQHGVLIIGWRADSGPDGKGGTQFQNYAFRGENSLTPPAGKALVRASKTGTAADSTTLLAVTGKGCLGADGLNEPTVLLDAGPIQVQGVKSETSAANCQGEVSIPPVTISGTAGSSWILALLGPAGSEKLAAIDVTPGA